MKSTLVLLAEKHDDWIRIVRSFGCNNDTSEDLVQEMYIKIHYIITKGGDIMYNDTEINHFYIFRTLVVNLTIFDCLIFFTSLKFFKKAPFVNY